MRIAGSAAAELVNWAIDRGYLPIWYTRDLKPTPTGEFQPRFDYRPGAMNPFEIYAIQQRHGCSYFQVGVAAQVRVAGDELVVTATDRELRAQRAHPLVEVAAWTKFFLTGALDRTKTIAASTRMSIGGRTLATTVIGATYAHDDLSFALRVVGQAGAP